MDKKKRYIVILVALVVFSLIMYFALGQSNIKSGKRELTLIVGDNAVWNYDNRKWSHISSNKTIEKLSWQDYKVYIDNKQLGNYYLWYDNEKWYIFDANRKAVTRNGPIIAYRGNYDIQVKDFQTEQTRNIYYVEKILKEKNLSTRNDYTVLTESKFDIDNDGIIENFYFVSNAFSMEQTPSKVFAFVFMIKNNQIYPIYESIEQNDNNVNGCKPYLSAVLDIDEDNIYEMVISCGRFSIQEPIDMLYKLSKNGFEMLISNQ